jgi:hypothetical protein
MKFVTILATRSKALHVKTLHSILRMNLKCVQTGETQNEIIYVADDPYEKSEIISKQLKRTDVDRIFFVEFGVHVDEDSLACIFKPHEGLGVVVFPAVREGVDWKMFKDNVLADSTEPVSQMGLHFDTEVNNRVSDEMYTVKATEPKCWLMMTKHVRKKVSAKVHPNPRTMFDKLKESGVKIQAYVDARLTITYTHECVSNIMNAAGVKTT